MKKLAIIIVAIVALLTAALADEPKSAATTDDISGAYSFLKDGEFVQINVEQGKLDGWISRFGELPSDKGAAIDQFFDKASLDGDKISFSTKMIHGVRYEFQGTVERGAAKSRAEEGYFVIHGNLTQYTTDAENKVTARQREVEFKLLAVDADTPNGKN